MNEAGLAEAGYGQRPDGTWWAFGHDDDSAEIFDSEAKAAAHAQGPVDPEPLTDDDGFDIEA